MDTSGKRNVHQLTVGNSKILVVESVLGNQHKADCQTDKINKSSCRWLPLK